MRSWLGLALMLWFTASASAAPPNPDRYQRFDVELITVGPGAIYWERFGHNAILLRDRSTGSGITYNFGMFDFHQQNFLLNFARGLMTYRVVKYRADIDLEGYRQAGRPVWVQQLQLTREQKNSLIDYLNWHTQPGNEAYRYHYFDANCSTKVRDALDQALGGAMQRHFSALPSGQTQRAYVRELTIGEPWLFAGTLLGLGRGVDRPTKRWADFFIPMEMKDALTDFQISDGNGGQRPLVTSTAQLFGAPAGNAPRAQPLGWALALGLLAALAIAWSARRGWRSLPLLWLLPTGVIGLVLAALWLLTDHEASANENLLLLSPLALIAAWGVAKRRRWLTGLSWLMLGMVILALLLRLPGWLYQDNWEVIAASLPPQLALLGWGYRQTQHA